MSRKISDIKRKLSAKNYILNGTLAQRYKQCGKTACCCNEDSQYWHGPYWIWTRKEKGKTITRTLNKTQAVMVKKAIKEMKVTNHDIQQWRALSLKENEKYGK